MATSPSLKLHRHPAPGHSHRARLALAPMGMPHERVDVHPIPDVQGWLSVAAGRTAFGPAADFSAASSR